MPRLTKQQREYRKAMQQFKKEGKVRDEYGQIVEPEKFHIDFSVVIKVLVSLYIVYAILTHFTGLGLMLKSYFGGGDGYTEEDVYDTYDEIGENDLSER